MSVEDVTVLVDYTVRKFCIQQVPGITSPIPSCPIPLLSTLGIPKVLAQLLQGSVRAELG